MSERVDRDDVLTRLDWWFNNHRRLFSSRCLNYNLCFFVISFGTEMPRLIRRELFFLFLVWSEIHLSAKLSRM